MDTVEELRRRHRDFFLHEMEELGKGLRAHTFWGWFWEEPPPDAAVRLDAMSAELDNVRTAIEWSLGRGEVEAALRLATSCAPAWAASLRHHEGRQHLEACIAAHEDGDDALTAAAYEALEALALDIGDLDTVKQVTRQALPMRRRRGDVADVVALLLELGAAHFAAGSASEAVAACEEALDIAMSQGDEAQQGVASYGLGWSLMSSDPGRAQAAFDVTLSKLRGDSRSVVEVLLGIANAQGHVGEFARQRELADRALVSARRSGDARSQVLALSKSAQWHLLQGETSKAATLYEEALDMARHGEGGVEVPELESGLARAAVLEGRFETARLLAEDVLERLAKESVINSDRYWVRLTCYRDLVEVALRSGDLGAADRRADDFLNEGTVRMVGDALNALSHKRTIADLRGDQRAAAAAAEEALTIAAAPRARVLASATKAFVLDDPAGSEAILERGMAEIGEDEHPRWASRVRYWIGRARTMQGRFDDAESSFVQGLRRDDLRDLDLERDLLLGAAGAALLAGSVDRARSHLSRVAAAVRWYHIPQEVAFLDLVGRWAAAAEQPLTQTLLVSAAVERRVYGIHLPREYAAWREEGLPDGEPLPLDEAVCLAAQILLEP